MQVDLYSSLDYGLGLRAIFVPAGVPMRKEDAKKFKEYLALGRELLTNLKTLATLEKASTMEKYEQSHVRKLSYAATEDTVSCVGTYLRPCQVSKH